eukprot:CAMPEP_0206268558 /NCGR_PEP_ID=MMETSP0047_2-20121206/31778_1 /ASSEMBLY_ACC=CAM_ASM_000192 /TAXON_ID=195065 /ORGANISM="Chroomonas mesostigmatica_cf, Strain CCMP1168" /LENGTH=227 /DNA_ID=CAMNT_0053696899 /DNA_START=33 /DNA_END=716 /DNA_ORIENTATION=-
MFKGDSSDAQKAKSCYLSHIHCAVILTSCLWYWATRPVYVHSSHFMVVGPDSAYEMQWMRYTVCYSVGYFLNDLLLIIQHPSIGGVDMLVHHIVIGVFFTSGLLDTCCTPYHFLFMIEELSTPFLNLRWQHRDNKEGKIYIISQALFVILFFLSRILVGTGFVWANGVYALPAYIARQPTLFKQVHLYLQLLACTLSRGLNLWWLWKIVKIVMRGGGKKYIDENKLD